MSKLSYTTTDAAEQIRSLYAKYPDLCQWRGREASAGVRGELLTALLHGPLGWPTDAITVDPLVAPEYLDYELRVARPTIVISTKAFGETFSVPYKKRMGSRRLRLSGTLRTNKELWTAIVRTQRHCVDQGARYAVATNGYTFVVFQALTEGRPWRNEFAVVFNGPKDLEEDFGSFWNLLSYESVSEGGLDNHFRGTDVTLREYHVPVSSVLEADATYGRNPFTMALNPYVETFFGDIGSQEAVDVLNHCYIYSGPTQVIDSELQLVINDHIPSFAAHAQQVETSDSDPAGSIGAHIRSLVDNKDRGSVVVLMGGIGSGKSTFLKRFFKVVAHEIIFPRGSAMLTYVDCLGAPDSAPELDSFVWNNVASRLKEQDSTFLQRATLEKIFADRLALIRELFQQDAQTLEHRTASQLYDFASNPKELSLGVLRFLPMIGRLPLVVFDNVDQLSADTQANVFTLAQHLALHLGCLAVLVLREESYCTAQMQKQLTAYTIRPFHLSSPSFRDLIRVRIEFAINAAAEAANLSSMADAAGPLGNAADLLDFLHLLRESVSSRNRNIVQLVEAVSFGNMRLALTLFNSFITSGATDLPKIIAIYREYGSYIIPFHEFIKSVMLGEHRYYKEARSSLMNVFHVTTARHASHFTTLRILRFLSGPYHSGKTGEEYVGLDALFSAVVTTFDNEDDCTKTLLRLIQINRQLVELDTRRTDSIVGASAARVTTSGRYYMSRLAKSFAYLDLVWHDTPFSEAAVSTSLQRSMHDIDLELRFTRVEAFLDYLEREELRELKARNLPEEGQNFHGPFMSEIREAYLKDRSDIRNRARRWARFGVDG